MHYALLSQMWDLNMWVHVLYFALSCKTKKINAEAPMPVLMSQTKFRLLANVASITYKHKYRLQAYKFLPMPW